MGQYASHIWSCADIDKPALLNNSPQLLGKSKTLGCLRFLRPVTPCDCDYHCPCTRDIPVRGVPGKNLMVCKLNLSGNGNDHIRTDLVHDHSKSVTVGLLCRSVIADSKLLRIKQFWAHPPSSPTDSERHERRLRSHRDQGGIGRSTVSSTNNGRETEVCETGSATLVNKDVCLIITMSGCAPASRKGHTPFKSPCTI